MRKEKAILKQESHEGFREQRQVGSLDWRRQKGKRNFLWILLLLKRNTFGFEQNEAENR